MDEVIATTRGGKWEAATVANVLKRVAAWRRAGQSAEGCSPSSSIAAKLGRLFRSALDALKVVESLKTRGVKLHPA
jgi:hypothetical protein